MRVLVCGDAHWNAYLPIRKALEKLPPGSVVIHGGCEGADRLAGLAARHLKLEVEEFRADFERYGDAAVATCNAEMLRLGRPKLVLAFHNDIESSKGTKDMVRRAREAGIEVRCAKLR